MTERAARRAADESSGDRSPNAPAVLARSGPESDAIPRSALRAIAMPADPSYPHTVEATG